MAFVHIMPDLNKEDLLCFHFSFTRVFKKPKILVKYSLSNSDSLSIGKTYSIDIKVISYHFSSFD